MHFWSDADSRCSREKNWGFDIYLSLLLLWGFFFFHLTGGSACDLYCKGFEAQMLHIKVVFKVISDTGLQAPVTFEHWVLSDGKLCMNRKLEVTISITHRKMWSGWTGTNSNLYFVLFCCHAIKLCQIHQWTRSFWDGVCKDDPLAHVWTWCVTRPDTWLSSTAGLCLQRERGATALRNSGVREQTDQVPNFYQLLVRRICYWEVLYSCPELEKKNPGSLL